MRLRLDDNLTRISERCFRLLTLRSELQNDLEVVKPLLQEQEVLRLSCALGMLTTINTKDFDFDLETREFDEDFAQFLGRHVFQRTATAATAEQMQVRGLFGKQASVQAYLMALGAWDDDMTEHLRDRDQGIFAVLLPDKAAASADVVMGEDDGGGRSSRRCHRLVVFGWLVDCLFAPNALRDTATYVLRFLTCLSPFVTCCLSAEDLDDMQAMVEAMTDDDEEWKSYSVAFHVECQETKRDDVRSRIVQTMALPDWSGMRDVQLIKGSFPALVAMTDSPGTKKTRTEKFKFNDEVELAKWLMQQAKNYSITFGNHYWVDERLVEAVLTCAECWPQERIDQVEEGYRQRETAVDESLKDECAQRARERTDQLSAAAEVLFSVDVANESQAVGNALELVQHCIDALFAVLAKNEPNDELKTTLYLPMRLCRNMRRFMKLASEGESELDNLLEKIVIVNSKNQLYGKSLTERWFGWMLSAKETVTPEFRNRMQAPLEHMKQVWLAGVNKALDLYQEYAWKPQAEARKEELHVSRLRDISEVKEGAFRALLREWEEGDLKLKLHVHRRMNYFHCKSESEYWEPPHKQMVVWKLGDQVVDGEEVNRCRFTKLGRFRMKENERILGVYSIQHSAIILVTTSSKGTTVHRVQFPLTTALFSSSRYETVTTNVRHFGRPSSRCDFNVKGRAMAFEEASGTVCLYRFNELFTSMEVTRTIDVVSRTSLELPLRDILIVEGTLVMVDCAGALQSVDVRSLQASRKAENHVCFVEDKWRSEVFYVLDGVAVGVLCAGGVGEVSSIGLTFYSSDDYRELPQSQRVGIEVAMLNAVSIQPFGDLLYLMDLAADKVYVIGLEGTIRSDSYRIRSVTDDVEVAQAQEANSLKQHWLWAWYHLYEKFPVEGQLPLQVSGSCVDQSSIRLELSCPDITQNTHTVAGIASSYFEYVMLALSKLNKPLYGLDLARKFGVSYYSSRARSDFDMEVDECAVTWFIQTLITFIPIQICRAEMNSLSVLVDGQDRPRSESLESTSSLSSADIARSIRFGLLSPFLQSWTGRCLVVTSMGKQSTGKSYFLNHLTGSSFAIAGARCTDGAWMCARVIRDDVLLIVIDFEGLGSFERTEQEDVLLSVLNASISMLTIFRMEMRFDKEIDDLFSRFQKGCQLLRGDQQLFNGKLFMSVKDVNPNDQRGVLNEFRAKCDRLLSANRGSNFLTEMYKGNLDVHCSPPLGTQGYYRSLKHAQLVLDGHLRRDQRGIFASGKAFLDCVRLVLAKISILDWTSLDESTIKFRLGEVALKLPDVIRVGITSSDRTPKMDDESSSIVDDVCKACPDLSSSWLRHSGLSHFDGIPDSIVTIDAATLTSDSERVDAASKFILQLFSDYKDIFNVRRVNKTVQKEFDVFLVYVIRRRRLLVQNWARSLFGGSLPAEWKDIEHRWFSPLQTLHIRCLDQCSWCQLGCMKSSTHGISSQHDCGTNHHCTGSCEYCAEIDVAGKTPPCGKPAGHEGKCECKEGDHTCGKECGLKDAMNCGKRCCAKVGHEGGHHCSVGFHSCGQQCTAHGCGGRCNADFQWPHTVHKCDTDHCLQNCVMEGCERTCSSQDHFHGYTEAKVALHVEQPDNLKEMETFDATSDIPVIHMCDGEHECQAMCEVPGVCNVEVFLKKTSKTFSGKRGNFQYTFQEMNGSRKKCAVRLAPTQQTHSGTHSCEQSSAAEDQESSEGVVSHYCDVRCPCCSYYCQKPFGHAGLHMTPHGNMRNTFFLADDQDIDVKDRKYVAGDRGTAEMCNLYCSKMGRQHIHFLHCDQQSAASCVYSGTSDEMRRHCTRELQPKPEQEMDELLHERFWESLGWEDPCTSQQERDEFGKCGYKCDAPDHEEKKPSYCVLPAWHVSSVKPASGYDGFSYIGGHKFDCSHTSSGDKMHHVFVLDCSGSMQGWPWEKLMGAFREYIHNRIDQGASLDLVSVITFDNYAKIVYEAQNITTMTSAHIEYRGGGTVYSCALRKANEVLSRCSFDVYRPVLVFFSDGQPVDAMEGEKMASHIREGYEKYGLMAFAVGFGTINLNVLERVSQRLGGQYQQALTGEELKSTFHSISASLGTRAGLALTKPLHESVCVICQKELAAEMTMVLTPCKHELHQGCFASLVERTSTGESVLCPSCRAACRGAVQ